MARDSLKLSEFGKDLVDQAARKMGWGHQGADWASAAHVTVYTLKRFWRRSAIDRGSFIAICEAVGVNWEKVVDEDEQEIPPNQLNQGYPASSRVIENSLQLQNLTLPQASHEALPDRPLALDSPFYIERPPIESECYNEILQPGSLISIKGLGQAGKTSLILRILNQATKQGYRTVRLNLRLAEKAVLSDLDKFILWFCANVSRELGLTLELTWDEMLGSIVSCKTYFENYLLPQIDNPLVLVLDEGEQIFQYPEIAQDFFRMLRNWYDEAQANNLDVWKKLRLILAYSTEVNFQLDNQSPFNVGLQITLPDFNPIQVQDLALRYGLDWTASQVEELMAMLGGHPYLIRLLLHQSKRQDVTLEQLLQTAITESGIYSDHLRRILKNLEQNLEVAIAFKKVVTADVSVQLDPIRLYQLQRLGLVQLQGNNLTPRCNLYRQYFCTRLRIS